MKIEPFVDSTKQMVQIGCHNWSVARIIHLANDLPVFEIPIEHLYIWYKYDDLNLRDMVGHIISVNNCDLKYPIILDEDGVLMDGRHRVMKSLLQGEKTIKAVRFETNPSPCKVDDE